MAENPISLPANPGVGSGAVRLQAPVLHGTGSIPLRPPPERKGLTNLPPWGKKHHFSLGPSVHGAE